MTSLANLSEANKRTGNSYNVTQIPQITTTKVKTLKRPNTANNPLKTITPGESHNLDTLNTFINIIAFIALLLPR